MRFTSMIICFLLIFTQSHTHAEEFLLTVQRESIVGGEPGGTVGTMYFGSAGQEVCKTLEPPDRNNETNISSIPAGTYEGSLRYDGDRGWRIQLKEVHDRKAIQIHVGNYPWQTSGCVLVGMEVDSVAPKVAKSKEAITALKKLFYGTAEPNSTPNKDIVIVIRDP